VRDDLAEWRRVARAVGAPTPRAATFLDEGTFQSWFKQAVQAAKTPIARPKLEDEPGMARTLREFKRLAGE